MTLVLTLVDEGPLLPAKITPPSEEPRLWQALQSANGDRSAGGPRSATRIRERLEQRHFLTEHPEQSSGTNAMTRTISALLTLACRGEISLHAAPPARANTPAKLPAAATILDRCVQVTGGAQLFSQYGQVTIHSTVHQDDGTTLYRTFFHSRDGATLTEIDAGAAWRQSGVSNGIVWEFSEAKGAHILSGKVAEKELAKARRLGQDDWRQLFPTAVTRLSFGFQPILVTC